MRTVVVFHDAYATPTDDWIPWLRTQLEAAGLRVLTPGLPKPPAVTLSSWMTEWSSFGFVPDAETILVGHGLGALFAIRILENLHTPIAGVVLVAPFATMPAHAALASVSASFLETPLDWDTVKKNTASITIFAGSDDPLVALTESEEVGKNLLAQIQAIEGAGHLTRGSGYGTFIQLADAILHIAFPDKVAAPAAEPTPAPIVMPTEPVIEVVKPAAPLVGIKTMEMQSAAALATANPSVIQTALSGARAAEGEKKRQRATNPKNLLRIIGGLVLLIIAGIALVIGVAKLIPQGLPASQNAALVPNAFLRAERVEALDVSTITSEKIRSFLTDARDTTPRDTARLLVLTEGANPAVLADTVGRISGAQLPVTVQGFMDGAAAIAIIHPNTTDAAFVVLARVRSYDGAFDALGAWEPTLPTDISTLVPFPGLDPQAKGLSYWDNLLFRNIPLRITVGPEIAKFTGSDGEGLLQEAALQEQQPDLIQTINTAVTNVVTPAVPTLQTPPSAPTTEPAVEVTPMPAEEPATPAVPTTRMVYFFLDPETLAITSNTDIVPELIRRYWGRPR